MRALLVVVALGVAVVACASDKPRPQAVYTPQHDAGYEDADVTVDACSDACVNLRSVGCAAGFSVDAGERCTVTCRHVRDTRIAPLDIECAVRARTPAEAHACRGWGCP